jgi:outer membrane lipoprotein SlyB
MHLKKIGAVVVCALGLAACGSSPSYDDRSNYYGSTAYNGSNSYTEYGRVVGIDAVGGSGHPSGAGAVIGGVVGGVLGHQVGSGRGNTAATIGGAVAGAAVGNEIEKRRESGDVGYRVDVRLDNGALRSVNTDHVGDIRVGDRVRLADGRLSRY